MPETAVAEMRAPSFQAELAECWRRLPNKGLFFGLLGLWVAFFHFLGNSTLGYVNTPSLFGWLDWIYDNGPDDAHGRYIPFVVLALFWWKRKEILVLPDRHWWPAIGLLAAGLLLHFLGFIIQQSQVSVVGFFVGLYAIIGIVWGPRWMQASFFPFILFAFSVPVQNIIGGLTFKLRMIATSITAVVCKAVLGINVIQDGTRIFDGMGHYEYEVAAACSGIRSLTATLAIAMIYAFIAFRSHWRKAVMIAAAFPLAVVANVFRLSTIVVAAEAFGQKAGNFVHENSILSLLPYVPSIIGILVLGRFLGEKRPEPKTESAGILASPASSAP
jgi:exosortase